MKKILTLFFFFFLTAQSFAYSTYYIRNDGGTDTQCTGLVDAAYPGSGTAQPCAYSHPYYALRVYGSYASGAFQSGDTMIIDPVNHGGSGIAEFPMGAGHATTLDYSGTQCGTTYSTDCNWHIPGGPDAEHPTRILGKGWDTATSYIGAPQLWGRRGIYGGVIQIVGGASNIEIQYLELTDHSACATAVHPSRSCGAITGDWARSGIYSVPSSTTSGSGSSNIILKNLNIHGFATYCGYWAGANGWTIENVICRGNGYGGMEGDSGHGNGDSMIGTFPVKNFTVEYTGCVEDYPDTSTILSNSCVSQSPGANYYGGNGDALAVYNGSPIFEFENFLCRYSTADCFDSLHSGGTTAKFRNSRFEGNAGQAIKINSTLTLENSIVIGDCGWFRSSGMVYNDGTNGDAVTMCRGGASTIYMGSGVATAHSIIGNTFFSNGDIIFDLGSTTASISPIANFRNNIVYGGKAYMRDTSNPDPQVVSDDDASSDFWYYYGSSTQSGQNLVNEDYDVIFGTKDGSGDCRGAHSLCADPVVTGTVKTGPYSSTGYYGTTDEYSDFQLAVSSPARYEVRGAKTADESVSCWGDCSLDYNYFSRGADGNWDTGGLEYGSTSDEQTPACKISGQVTFSGSVTFQ